MADWNIYFSKEKNPFKTRNDEETEIAEVNKIVDDVADQFGKVLLSAVVAERNEEIAQVTGQIFQFFYDNPGKAYTSNQLAKYIRLKKRTHVNFNDMESILDRLVEKITAPRRMMKKTYRKI